MHTGHVNDKRTVLVSSCLLGLKTRYDGTDNYSKAVIDYLNNNQLIPIPVCPEQLAGLATPRPKCWFSRGDGKAVINRQGSLCNETGEDVTNIFISGAKQTLKLANLTHCKHAILQQRSPSCGTKMIYLQGELITGIGVTSALLKQNGIQVFGDDELPTTIQ